MSNTIQSPTADNGVNVEALLGAKAALTEAPEAARFKWRATSEWISGAHSRASVDGFYGLGDYTRAAELYRAALSKSGVDTNQVNLRLGMALARGGDKAGAATALGAVTGPLAELAKFWLLYANRPA